jgi:hypothetical protein
VSEEVWFPAVPPQQQDDLDRIEKLVTHMCRSRSGVALEEKIKEKNKNDSSFSFLFGGEYSSYYKWRLLCALRQYSDDIIQHIKHQHADRIETIPLGALNLTSSDKNSLQRLLRNNTGTRDCIKELRTFIIARAHSGAAVGIELKDYAQEVYASSSSNSLDTETGTQKPLFIKILHLIYVINDVFFNRTSATLMGPYTEFITELKPSWTPPSVDYVTLLLPQVHKILSMAYWSTNVSSESEKLQKLVDLWVAKKFITEDQASQCRTAMTSPPVDLSPPNPVLFPPHILNLPPGNIVAGHVAAGAGLPANRSFSYPQPHHRPSQPFNPAMPMPTFMPPPFHPPFMPHNVAMPRGFVPPSSGLMQQSPPPMLDLHCIPVGIMSNIIRNVLKLGHEPYTPLSFAEVSQPPVSPSIEPGRLEARVLDYYRKVEKGHESKSSTNNVSDDEYRMSSRKRSRGDSFSDEVDSIRISQFANRPVVSLPPASIPGDNLGHQILRGLGWQDGEGLGVSNSGIVDPIQASDHKGKTGLGGDTYSRNTHMSKGDFGKIV